MIETLSKSVRSARSTAALSDLKNFGPATRENFHLLGIETVAQLAEQNADDLVTRLIPILRRHPG